MKLSYAHVQSLAKEMAIRIEDKIGAGKRIYAYAVPRGGVPAALAAAAYLPSLVLLENADQADVIIDDLIDSGTTRERFNKEFPFTPFFALLNKQQPQFEGKWIEFPWDATPESSFEDNVIRLLQYVGEDPSRGGLLETPGRVAKAWRFWCNGYDKNPADILKVFEDGAENHDQMVTVKDIPIYSHCEHHMAPIFGTVTISYIPNGKIVGLSKLSRLADMYARRLQVQERMTDQIADALFMHLGPRGVGVMMKARHLCMESRGVCQQGHHTVTTALRGVIKDEEGPRSEFLRLAR